MKICPWCEAGYPDELTTCPLHGGLLSEIRDLKPGMLVRSTYRILRKLGQGGMANVYLAQHILLNEPQVLKFLSSELSRDQEWTSRFLREVRTLRQIRHKNVINAGNLEPAEDGTLFFSMEFVDGPDLLEFCRRAPQPFDVSLALELIRGAGEGLGAAHAAGVVHRDVKPENILIACQGQVLVPKIADFGIVATREESRLTRGGTALLTPQFAAPEQWRGTPTAELDGRTDLYALGGVLFELLTGRCAFSADNYQGWAQQHMHSPAPEPSSLRPDLKEWHGLDDLVLSLLAKNPQDRPENVAAAIGLLDAVVHVQREPLLVVPFEPRQIELPQFVPPQIGPQVIEPPASRVSGPAPTRPEPTSGGKPETPELVPVSAGDPATPLIEPEHRVRVNSGPVRVWESRNLISSTGPRIVIRRPETAPKAPAPRLFMWIVATAVIIVLLFAARSLMESPPVNSRELVDQRDAIFALAFAPNGINLASASSDNTVQFWNVEDGLPLGTIDSIVTSLAYSPDGRALATGMADNSIDIWDTTNNAVLVTMAGHSGRVAAVAFSPDGQTLASASWDNTVRIWNVSSGHPLRTMLGHTGHVLALGYSPDGRALASAGDDATIRLWDPARGTLLRTLHGHVGAIYSIAFSPDGRTLASASDDQTIKLWNPATGQLVRTLHGDTAPVLSVSFGPNGRTLASGSADTTVRLWDVATGQALRVLRGHRGPVNSVAFSPDGSLLASGSADKTIRIWEVANLRR